MSRPAAIVAGCVVLYECDVDLAANLATYADDLDMLVVVDNSMSRDPAIAAMIAARDNADYVFNDANLGIAAALNLAVAWARARGADFLLTMDQDSGFNDVPFRDFRDRVLSLPFLADLAVAAPLAVVTPRGADEVPAPAEIVDSTTVITSGSIISLAGQARIGPFDEHLFIDEVDHDYCLRAHDLGLRVVTLTDVTLRHRLGGVRTVSILGRSVTWNVHPPIRHYYMVRNGLYMTAKHGRSHPGYSARRLIRLSQTIAAALLLAPRRRERFAMVMQGIRDCLSRRMGAWRKINRSLT